MATIAVLAVLLLLSCFQGHVKSEAPVLEKKLSGKVVTYTKVNLPADEIWDVYRSPDYLKLLASLQPDFYKSVTYVHGDGRQGTIVNVTVAPGTHGEYWYDKITKIDDKTRTRVLTHIQGRFRDMGFTYFASEYHVIKTGKSSSTIKFSLLFDVKEYSLSNITKVIKTWDPATIIVNYVNSERSKPVVLDMEFSGEIVSDLHVNIPANELWHQYRRKDFYYLLSKIMSYYYKTIKYLNGSGEVGTSLDISLQPAYGSVHWVEKITRVDDEKKTRAIRYVRGGYLDSGFTKYERAFSVIPVTQKSSVIREFEAYKIKPESLSKASALQPTWDTAIAMAKYTISKKT